MRVGLVVFYLCVSASVVHCGNSSAAWCYHDPSCNEFTWPDLASNSCGGTRQSPINILSASAQSDPTLTPFTFTNFSSKSALTKIENTGQTIKVTLASGVEVSKGGLSEPYHSLQFQLHWGNGVYLPGSEHTLDGKRYPMELHIMNIKASHKENTTSAVADPTGLAALGFFIDGMPTSEANKPEAWHSLTKYLDTIKKSGTSVPMSPGISLDDLLVGVDRTQYYRYLGSLTTPDCDEAVVWTVFKDPVKISPRLAWFLPGLKIMWEYKLLEETIDLFSSTVYVTNSTTTFMKNVYRNLQPYQPVTTQPEDPATDAGVKGYSELLTPLQNPQKTNKHTKD